MTNSPEEGGRPLLVKRYASRRLYNTETSDYVTLDDIAEIIRGGREVQIVDLKTGDDLTSQYLLQIIAEHEGRGESVLPVQVLVDLVRSYALPGGGLVPQFLRGSFELLRENQSKMMDSVATIAALNPMASMPGFDAMKAQQEAFLKALTGGPWMPGGSGDSGDSGSSDGSDESGPVSGGAADAGTAPKSGNATTSPSPGANGGQIGKAAAAGDGAGGDGDGNGDGDGEDLDAIKSQVADLQAKLARMG